jgi:hypothetical protein
MTSTLFRFLFSDGCEQQPMPTSLTLQDGCRIVSHPEDGGFGRIIVKGGGFGVRDGEFIVRGGGFTLHNGCRIVACPGGRGIAVVI